jgi:hypothetical protein
MKIKTGVTNVSTSGTAVQIRNTAEVVIRIYLTPLVGNTSHVYFGDSTVEGSGTVSGIELPKGSTTSEPILLEFSRDGEGGVQFKDLYVDAATNGDDLSWMAVIQ